MIIIFNNNIIMIMVTIEIRAALTEGDQLMSSPPISLVSSWAHERSDFPKE